MGKRVWARRPFQYQEMDLDRGQLFELRGAPNDEKLERLGYVAALEKGTETYECGECGAKFVDMGMRSGHGQKRHPSVPRTPQEQERFEEREEAMLIQQAPLNVPDRQPVGA